MLLFGIDGHEGNIEVFTTRPDTIFGATYMTLAPEHELVAKITTDEQRVKVEAAKKRLESTTQTISEVMYGIGYNDDKAFRKTFKKYSGLSPIDYRMKYNREMAKA